MSAPCSLTGSDFARAIAEQVATSAPKNDGRQGAKTPVVLGANRRGDPDREIAIEGQGGREEVWPVGARQTARWIRDRVRVVVRQKDRRGDTAWMHAQTGIIRQRLLSYRGGVPLVVPEQIYLSPGQLPFEVRSTYEQVWFFQSSGPRTRIVGEGRSGGGTRSMEAEYECKFFPFRARPVSAPLGPWPAASLRVYVAGEEPAEDSGARTVRTVVAPAGGDGMVRIGGRVTLGPPVPVMLPADDRAPEITQGRPAQARPDGLLWTNRNVGTERSGGSFDLFDSGQTSAPEVLQGIDLQHAIVVSPNQIRLTLSAYPPDADEDSLVFLLQDDASPPNRYLLPLSSAARNDFNGEDNYLLPFAPAAPITALSTWTWGLADTRLFRLQARMSRPRPPYTYDLTWGAAWLDGTEVAPAQRFRFPGDATRELRTGDSQRNAGGTLVQTITLVARGTLRRNEEYAVSARVEGCIVSGETAEGLETPEDSLNADFSEDFL